MSLYCINCHKLTNKKYKCKCDCKTIFVHNELMVVFKRLMERGFKVISTSLETYDLFLGHPYIDKITHIQI